jgi:peptidoglycan-associated lipoprotein
MGACHKTVSPTLPGAPPVAENSDTKPPVINFFNSEPATVAGGQDSMLRWSVSGANEIQIDNGVGYVAPNGSRAVRPTETTTFHLKAVNANGPTGGSVTVTVTPSDHVSQVGAGAEQSVDVVSRKLQDVHFDYNVGDVRPEDEPILQADAELLQSLFKSDPSAIVTIEGHCDERGSDEYNVGLADKRANAVKEFLVKFGVPGDRLNVVGYGKELPLCSDETDECYARNRRAHFSASQRKASDESTSLR